MYKQIDDIDWMILTAKRFPVFQEMAPRLQKEVLEVYKRSAKVAGDVFNSTDGLCFLNKYLSLTDLTVYDHDKSRLNTILIPYNYDPQAQCPLWNDKLPEIMDNDINKIKCIQEFFGYCLTRGTENAKALFCIGEGATGKSTVLDVLSKMVGDENVSVLSPRFYKDSMRITSIENKLVLMSHEIPKGLEDYEAEFRQIVCGQALDVHQKFIKPYKFTPFCKIILAMNEIPRINDHTSAFYRRVLPIEFNKQFEEEKQDKNLIKKLVQELPGILNWSIEGLKRLRERGGFFKDAYMKEHIEEIRLQNNPIALWAGENIIAQMGKHIIKQEAYQKYTVWCGLNGYKSLGHAKFGMELYRIYRHVTSKNTRETSGDNRQRIWPNLTWITSANRQEPEEKKDEQIEAWEE